MRHARSWMTLGLGLLVLAGCGSSGSKAESTTASTATSSSSQSTTAPASTSTEASATTSTTSTSAAAPLPPFTVSFPAFASGAAGAAPPLPARYTCDGADLSPAVNWSNVPRGTKELALFIAHSVQKGTNTTNWAVVGLKPTLTGIAAGKLPAGAIVGRNGSGKLGYSICPAKGSSTLFGVALYALPHHVAVKQGFNGVVLLNKFENEPAMAETFLSYRRP
jgi:phosphatidylethanolamine-binding protein (PEBP) family uncharacterized protein